MKRGKRILAAFLALMLFCSEFQLPVYAETSESEVSTETAIDENTLKSGNFYYEVLGDNTVSILKYESEESDTPETHIEIPETIEDLSVTALSEEAFAYNETIETVVIPETVTSIGNAAFYRCENLKAIVFCTDAITFGFTIAEACSNLEKIFVLESFDATNLCALLVNDLGEEQAQNIDVAVYADKETMLQVYEAYLSGAAAVSDGEETTETNEQDVCVDSGEIAVRETESEIQHEITTNPDSSIATVRTVFLDKNEVPLYDHIKYVHSSGPYTKNYESYYSGSCNSFSKELNESISLSDAEFTFYTSGDYWKIYNEFSGQYLTNDKYADTFFTECAKNMLVTVSAQTENAFNICRAEGNRYVIFYDKHMEFDTNSSFMSDYTDGSYDLVLLEKQDTISADDVLPGYKRVSEIQSGGKYLITSIWSDGSIMLLYPENGTVNQTKLVGESVDFPRNITIFRGYSQGTTTAVVGDITYTICIHPSSSDTGGNIDWGVACGESLTYIVDSGGKLIVSGSGAMEDYTLESTAPWNAVKDQIELSI